MANADVIEGFLRKNGSAWCDDCLALYAGIFPRQQVNQICRNLKNKNVFYRQQGKCAGCGNEEKIVNSISEMLNSKDPKLSSGIKDESFVEVAIGNNTSPWYWEGNIQALLATHLARKGYKIMSVAATSLRRSGKDIEAVAPEGRKLWVSVKGWPEKSPNTQARHWFAGALMDIILYREESKETDLALAFPDGFSTYLNLAQKVSWFKNVVGLRLFFVSENGDIREE